MTVGTDPITALVELSRQKRSLPPPVVCRELRVRSGLTLREVAAALGVSLSALWRWENGERVPRPEARGRYLELLEQLARESDRAAV